jgi:hypothetical protein
VEVLHGCAFAKTDSNTEYQKESLETLKNVALQVAEKAQAGSAELSQSVSEKISALSTDILGAFQKLSETSAVLLEAQKALTESIDNRVVKEKEATDALGGNIVETAELMRVNQSELSANLEMLRTGLESIIEKAERRYGRTRRRGQLCRTLEPNAGSLPRARKRSPHGKCSQDSGNPPRSHGTDATFLCISCSVCSPAA